MPPPAITVANPPLVFDQWRPIVVPLAGRELGRRRRVTTRLVGFRVCPHGFEHYDPAISDAVVAMCGYVVGPPSCDDDDCKAVAAAAWKAGRR